MEYFCLECGAKNLEPYEILDPDTSEQRCPECGSSLVFLESEKEKIQQPDPN